MRSREPAPASPGRRRSSAGRARRSRTTPDPLSATNMPYFIIARRITRTVGENDVVSKFALRRTRIPIGGSALLVSLRRVVPRRRDVRLARARAREPQRVVDRALRHRFVVPHEPGKDRQSGSVGRRPTCRSQRVRAQVEDRARSGRASSCRRSPDARRTTRTASTRRRRRRARAGRRRSSPRLRSARRRNRIRPGVALVSVVERHRHLRLVELRTTTYGMPFGAPFHTVPKSGCRFRNAAGRDQRRRVRIDWLGGDVRVPRIVIRKRPPTPERLAAARRLRLSARIGGARRPGRFGGTARRKQQRECGEREGEGEFHVRRLLSLTDCSAYGQSPGGLLQIAPRTVFDPVHPSTCSTSE